MKVEVGTILNRFRQRRERVPQELRDTQAWLQLVDRKLGQTQSYPARLSYTLRSSDVGYYITILQQVQPYTVVFFDSYDGKINEMRSAIAVTETHPIDSLLYIPGSDSWDRIIPNTGHTDILKNQFNFLNGASEFNHVGGKKWHGLYPDVEKVIAALEH